MTVDRYELALAILGLVALAAAWLPAYTERRPVSLPVLLVLLGVGVFALPLGFPDPDPRRRLDLTEHLTELVVIVSLMGAGLKIDRPFRWRTWSSSWRLLAITMPLTILATTLVGVAAGFTTAAALLLGASLAPTDPVLASDVQVGEPMLDDQSGPEAEDDVRFALTSEGGLNDALAFPFVYLAMHLSEHEAAPALFGRWLAWDLVGRTAVGLAIGVLVGWLLGRVAFRPPGRLSALADTRQGFVAVGATLLAYGATELLSGYGFLAVFVAAVALRNSERGHEFHAELHRYSEQTETLLVVGLLLVFGGALVTGVLGALTLTDATVAVLLVFVIRPITGLVALAGSGLSTPERAAIAFFGIRGFGSVYYLAYAIGHGSFPEADRLWAIVALAMLLSIAAHGVTATPVMRIVDRAVRRRERRRRPGRYGDGTRTRMPSRTSRRATTS